MSDHDAPDPIDDAYVQAEAMLSEGDARAARRARVLAAVAGATPEPAVKPRARRTVWRHGGWLAAAGVAGVSLFIATRIERPAVFEGPSAPPAAGPAAPLAPATPPAVTTPPAAAPSASPVATAKPAPLAQEPAAQPAARDAETVVTGGRIAAPLAEPQPMELPPAPPLPAPPPAAMARAAAPPSSSAQGASRAKVEELVVTSTRRRPEVGDPALAALTARLHAAAAAGRTAELARLLAQGVPVDALDDDGDTALIESVRARQLDAAALLRRRGADLDHPNLAGASARDLAAEAADPKLNRALGLDR